MKNSPTCHAHLQSLDSASTIDDFIKRELELGTGYLCTTDHGYLGACLEVYKKAKEKGLKPILGVEGYHRDDNCSILTAANMPKNNKGLWEHYKYGHFCAHALDQAAYESLVKQVSVADLTAEAHGSERKPIFNWAVMEELGKHNITMTSGCLAGVVARHLKVDRPDLAIKYYEKMRSIVKPGNFYVEISPLKCDKNWVSGVFITLEDGSVIKYYMGKKVKTDFTDEISVAELSKVFKSGKEVGRLRAVKDYSSWVEFENPKKIIKCEMVEDFISNECTPLFPDGDLQAGLNRFVMGLAKKYGDKIIIGDDSHFAYASEKLIQECRLSTMGDNFKFYQTNNRKSSEEAYAGFKDSLKMSERDFEEIVNNSFEWASRFDNFKLSYQPSLPSKFYPQDTLNHLFELINQHGRMDWSDKTMCDRLKAEVDLLYKNGYVDWLPYFFLAEEVPTLYIKNGKLPGAGRGSAAGMLVAYLLGITHSNPLDHGLSMERFMTLDRIASGRPPDIDQDLPNRDLLVDPENPGKGWLNERFGDHYAQISTNGLLRLKSSIKDMARHVTGSVSEEIEKLCKTIPNTPQGVEDLKFVFGYISEDGTKVPGLIEWHKPLQGYIQKYPDQWAAVQKCLRIVRNKGRHASAYVVCNEPVDDFIPMMTINGIRATQYTMKQCEAAGAIKMDYLCLKTLEDLTKAINLIQARSGMEVPEYTTVKGKKVPKIQLVPHNGMFHDIYNLPEDQAVYNDICSGNTETIFQVNTHGARKWLREFNHHKPGDDNKKLIYDIDSLAVFIALDRKGPLDAYVSKGDVKRNMLQEYAAGMRGESPLDPIPFLRQALPELQGILVYQEALQSVYQKITDCTGAEANAFREKIAKKEVELVNKLYPDFIEKASKKVGEEQAKKIWDQMATASGYSFNKSHAVSYAKMAYACAYFKHYFPKEWWCAVLTNATKTEIGEKFWMHCKDFCSFPDLTKSGSQFEIQEDMIVAPLNILQGVGENAHKEIELNKPYKSIEDFCASIFEQKRAKAILNPETGKMRAGHSSLDQGVVSSLIISGAMDSLFPKGLPMIEKLEMYQAAMAKTHGQKQKPIHPKYANLTPLRIYQYRKQILPIHSESLIEAAVSSGVKGFEKTYYDILGDTVQGYVYKPDAEAMPMVLKQLERAKFPEAYKVVDGGMAREFNERCDIIDLIEKNRFKVAVVGYVVEYKKFTFKDKTCAKFILDIDGEQIEFVRWPSRESDQFLIPDVTYKGSIVIAMVSRYSNQKPFILDAVVRIQEPLEE